MAPTLYLIPESPPSCAVLMTAKSIGLDLDVKEVNFSQGEHKRPAFLKLNPQHTVPVLVDEDGFTIWDSHAIMPYLLSKYAKDDCLYPKDAKARAVIDQRMHFDSGVAWARLVKMLKPVIYKGVKTILQEDVDGANEIYSFIEIFLDADKWVAGSSVTIADFSFLTTITAMDVLVKIDREKFPKLIDYVKRGTELSVYQEVAKNGHEIFVAFVNSLLGEH